MAINLANYEGLHAHALSVSKKDKKLMAKEEMIEFKGKVTELLPNATFRVKLENDHEILAHTSGKLRRIE